MSPQGTVCGGDQGEEMSSMEMNRGEADDIEILVVSSGAQSETRLIRALESDGRRGRLISPEPPALARRSEQPSRIFVLRRPILDRLWAPLFIPLVKNPCHFDAFLILEDAREQNSTGPAGDSHNGPLWRSLPENAPLQQVLHALRGLEKRLLDERFAHRRLTFLAKAHSLIHLGILLWHPASDRLIDLGESLHSERFDLTTLKSLKDLAALVRSMDEDELVAACVRVLMTGQEKEIRVVLGRSDKESILSNFNFKHLVVDHTSYILITLEDVSDQFEREERIRYLAYHDTLTGLSNRLHFQETGRRLLERSRREGRQVALLMLDLDDFKRINDTLGHSAGDELLKAVADRLRRQVRSNDGVFRTSLDDLEGAMARMGGDEFTILIPDLPSKGVAARLASRILKAMTESFSINGHDVVVSCSVGVVVFPGDGEDLETLLKNADTAMYRAKEGGRNAFRVYEPGMNARAMERLNLENGLREALESDQLFLVYQPKVDLRNGGIVGAEALIRWRHPRRGVVPPNVFIPIAEENGTIIRLGEWVLRKACEQMVAWRRQGIDLGHIAVNVSQQQLHASDLSRMVRSIMDSTGLKASRIELELTESALMENSDAGLWTLNTLRREGVRVAIDDFGTGYSSFSRLKQLPADALKIDRSFIRDLTRDPESDAIITAMIAMAATLHLEVVAEGIETWEQLAFLRERGCDLAQGYLLGKPMDPAALAEYIRHPLDLRLKPPPSRGEADMEGTAAQ